MLPRRKNLAAALAGLLVAACSHGDDAPQFTTAAVDRGDVAASVTAGGTLQPLVTVQVGTQVSGRIESLSADFNSTVKKGQIIARIDPEQLQSAVDRAQADLQSAKANVGHAAAVLADSQRQYQRARELAPQGLIAQQDLDTAQVNVQKAQADLDVARASQAQAQASLKQAQVNLGYTVIRSPTDGTVITRSVDVGQTVAASLQAPTLFTIAQDLRKMQVHTSVAESDVGQLTPGMAAEFTVDAYPNHKFTATVSQVRVSPQTQQNVVTYDAVADVNNEDLRLKPGMTANVVFHTAQMNNVLRVPNAALRFRPTPELFKALGMTAPGGDAAGAAANKPAAGAAREHAGGGRRVWVKDAAGMHAVRVAVGPSDGTRTAVTEGELKEGDPVITSVKLPTDSKTLTGMPRGF